MKLNKKLLEAKEKEEEERMKWQLHVSAKHLIFNLLYMYIGLPQFVVRYFVSIENTSWMKVISKTNLHVEDSFYQCFIAVFSTLKLISIWLSHLNNIDNTILLIHVCHYSCTYVSLKLKVFLWIIEL